MTFEKSRFQQQQQQQKKKNNRSSANGYSTIFNRAPESTVANHLYFYTCVYSLIFNSESNTTSDWLKRMVFLYLARTYGISILG